MSTWYGTMTIDQVEDLEGLFATFKGDHWEIPLWLFELRQNVLNQQSDRAATSSGVTVPC